MRSIDGFIHRLPDGLVVDAVTKNGQAMTLHTKTGERWQLWFVNPDTGDLIPGQPAVIGTQDFRIPDHVSAPATDGQVNRALVGKTVERVKTNGRQALFELVGGDKVCVAWVDENGERIDNCEPCLRRVDVVVAIPGIAAFNEAWGA